MAKEDRIIELLEQMVKNTAKEPVAPVSRKINDRFVDNGDGTVTDHLLKVMWVRRPHTDLPDKSKGEMNWEEAWKYCQALSYAGYSDWNLPTAREIASIIDFERINPAIDTSIFPDIKSSWYWTKTQYPGDKNCYRCAGLYGGNVGYYHEGNTLYVWPVRSSQ